MGLELLLWGVSFLVSTFEMVRRDDVRVRAVLEMAGKAYFDCHPLCDARPAKGPLITELLPLLSFGVVMAVLT
jgi:hypothetical protein